MRLEDLVAALDAYFRTQEVRNDDWSDTFELLYPDPYWREYAEPGYESGWNGLMMRGSGEVRQVATCVFPSDRIVAGLEPGTFLFSEHPADLGAETPVQVVTRPRDGAGRVAVVAGGGANVILEASLERGCQTYVTGNAVTRCQLDFVREGVRAFRRRAEEVGVAVVDATHYGLEKAPQLVMVECFRARGLEARFVPDGQK